MERHLSKSELLVELSNHKGLIPVDLDLKNNSVKWMDLERYHFYEGFFHKSLKIFSTLKGRKNPPFAFSTKTDVFSDNSILNDNLYPTGFIFHAGRCGSTLLVKVFARLRKNLVLSEVSLHNKFWLAITDEGTKTIDPSDENKRFYKNLLLATTRRRLSSHQYCFIKFTSFNIHFYDFIREVFPDVPALFLYREPDEILSSINKNPLDWIEINNEPVRELWTGVLENEFRCLQPDIYQIKVLENLFGSAIKARENHLNYLNFNQLKAEKFTEILNLFRVDFTSDEINKMKGQFNYYSKSETKLINYLNQSEFTCTESSKIMPKYALAELQKQYQFFMS